MRYVCLKIGNLTMLKVLTSRGVFGGSGAAPWRKFSRSCSTKPSISIEDLKSKIIYNCELIKDDIRVLSQRKRRQYGLNMRRELYKKGGNIRTDSSDAICLKYLGTTKSAEQGPPPKPHQVVQFPFRYGTSVVSEEVTTPDEYSEMDDTSWIKSPETLLKKMVKAKNWLPHSPEIVNDAVFVDEDGSRRMIQYGTVDPRVPVSDVPCGGCGALMHCQDTSIPGFLPKEIFHGLTDEELKTLICQRCHFLKEYDIALGVNVTPDDYPKILSPIRGKKALVLLMVDLLDVPCSIWPGLMDLIGHKRPIVVVANKVDLLVHDSIKMMESIKSSLFHCLLNAGVPKSNIKHVALISAKSGYGVESLITKIHTNWKNQGDIYIVGCTNVGKSTLFNTLIQSDMCKVQAVDLMQRATVSQWPGTTLNLLRFPVMKPSDWRLFIRKSRLLDGTNEILAEEHRNERLRKTLYKEQAPLKGDVGRSFLPECALDSSNDPFSLAITNSPRGVSPLGLDPNSTSLKDSKWCYDTPGVVHPDQILNLLTTTEIMATLPKSLVIPRVLHLRPGHSVLIAGLARLDLLQGPDFVWLTVFAADTLPITVTKTEDVEMVYNELLGTDLLKVPSGGNERLQKWPDLVDQTVEVVGKYADEAAAELVMSSAGWVAVTLNPAEFCKIRAWTPEGRGIHLRPPFLKKAHKLKGRRILKTPMFKSNLKIVEE